MIDLGEKMVGDQARTEAAQKIEDGSIITNVDLWSERRIVDVVQALYPGVGVITEEKTTSRASESGFVAVIDPLDGSKDYVNNGWQWATSVGIVKESTGEVVAASVVQPMMRRALFGVRGSGIWITSKDDYLRGTWRPYEAPKHNGVPMAMDVNDTERYRAICDMLSPVMFVHDPHRLHAVAAGLATLTGEASGWWSVSAHTWDIAGLTLLFELAGMVIRRVDKKRIDLVKAVDGEVPTIVMARSKDYADRICRALRSCQKSYA